MWLCDSGVNGMMLDLKSSVALQTSSPPQLNRPPILHPCVTLRLQSATQQIGEYVCHMSDFFFFFSTFCSGVLEEAAEEATAVEKKSC